MMMTSTLDTRRRRHAVGAQGTAAGKPVRHIAEPSGEAEGASDRDDTALTAALEQDVDSTAETQLNAMFAEPLDVHDDAIIDDADSTGSRRR